MEKQNTLQKLMEKGLKNKGKKTQRFFPKIKFAEDEWVVHTYDSTVQQGISDYLNSKSWDNQMSPIFYKGKIMTCFPIKHFEMLVWLRKNSEFPHNIFHRKGKHAEWKMLLPTTIVK